MTVAHVYDNFVGPWGDSGALGATYQLGTPVKANLVGKVTKLGWYRLGVGTNYDIEALSLWDQDTQSRLVHLTTLTDSGVAGWQWTSIPSADRPTTTVGQNLRVVVSIANGKHAPKATTSGFGPYQLELYQSGRVYSAGADGTYPATFDSSYSYGVDLEWDDGGGDPTPTTVGNDTQVILNKLASYWDVNDAASNTASMVKWIYDSVGAVKQGGGDALSTTTASIKTDTGNLWTSVGSGLGTAVSGISTSLGTGFRTAFDAFKSGWDTWRGVTAWTWDTAQAVFALEGTLLQGAGSLTGKKWVDMIGKLYSFLGAYGRESIVPGSGWAQVATTPLTGALAWNQPADLYLLSFTSTPSNAVGSSVDGVPWLGHMAWWAEWDGNQAGSRNFIDFPTGFLVIPGRRMAGVLIKTNGPCNGTVSAWDYTAP